MKPSLNELQKIIDQAHELDFFNAVIHWRNDFKKALQKWRKQCEKDGVTEHSLVFILIKEISGQ